MVEKNLHQDLTKGGSEKLTKNDIIMNSCLDTQTSETRMAKLKRLLRVDSDETEDIHTKYHQTSEDMEKKLKQFQEQLNIKVYLNKL